MIFDFEMIDSFYKKLDSLILDIRKNLNHPLTLSEKILFSHIYHQNQLNSVSRGVDYAATLPAGLRQQVILVNFRCSRSWAFQAMSATPAGSDGSSFFIRRFSHGR